MFVQNTKLRILCLVAAVCLGSYALAIAQPKAGNDSPAPPAANDPNASAPAPAEASPLLIEPKTPAEIFDAAVLCDKLALPTHAKRYLEKLLESQPTDEVFLSLRDKLGPAIFLKLANNEKLRPASTQLLDRVNDAFRKRAVDPKYIDELLAGLAGSPQDREVSESTLYSTGSIAVPRILQRIENPGEGEHERLIQAMITMGPQVIPALLGALESPSEYARMASIETLGWLHSKDVLPYLWYPAFAEKEPTGLKSTARESIARLLGTTTDKVVETSAFGAARELSTTATRYLAGEFPWTLRDDGTVELWTWDSQNNILISKNVRPYEASLHAGLSFARQALALAPEDKNYQALVVAVSLAAAKQQSGAESALPTGPGSVHNLALSAGAETVSNALGLAMKSRNADAALAALEVLGQIGTPHQLFVREAQGAPVIAALNFPDRRVQFAAATTVLKIDPENRFRGSERVVSILARALQGSGMPKCLVVTSHAQRGSATAGLVGQMGYEPLVTQTGMEGFKLATEQTDVELILLDANTIRWPLSMTLANLRADSRTAAIPIAVLGPESVKTDVERLVARYPFTTFVVEPLTLDGISSQLRPFLDSLATPQLTPEQRSVQTAAAAYWLAEIADCGKTGIYNLAAAEKSLSSGLNDARLSRELLAAMSGIGTVSAQEQLQEFSTSTKIDNATRGFAASRLARHIRRFGLLLSVERVAELEKAWRSEADPAVATALAAAVGSLKPNPQRVGGRLQRFGAPAEEATPAAP